MLNPATSCRDFLTEELHRRTRSNPRYSQRAFARQLGMSPGELSEVLRGKRSLSLRSALKAARALALNPEETRELVLLSQADRGGALPPPDSRDARPRELTMDFFRIVSDWYCFAILNLSECTGATLEPAYLARRLGISQAEARIALERLERVGLIERRQGRLLPAPDYVISPSGIPSEAIRNYHSQILDKAKAALESQALEERDITGLGLAIDPRHLPAIKKELSEFQDRIAAKYSTGRKTEVYQLEIALFRLTERDRK
ncbi:MAG: DUF4423 domain-containing protein [Oligoflexia bacterium]|nr:DUF4423 domain-containing protein [Oligoflexia bacterium]